jgi:hypothetical protein
MKSVTLYLYVHALETFISSLAILKRFWKWKGNKYVTQYIPTSTSSRLQVRILHCRLQVRVLHCRLQVRILQFVG